MHFFVVVVVYKEFNEIIQKEGGSCDKKLLNVWKLSLVIFKKVNFVNAKSFMKIGITVNICHHSY